MRLHLFKETDVRLPRKKLEALFAAVTGEEAAHGAADVNVVFTTDPALRKLNKQFRQIDRPTDVLSFNIDDADDAGGTFGEIYISVPTAQRQAADYGAPLAEELVRLTCHGLLHLFGYDHHREDDAARMKAREEHFLALTERRG